MNTVPTALRVAFERARVSNATGDTTGLVRTALKRPVGLIPRKTMWSVQRGKR